jgi:hypothetical protein
MNSRRVLIGSLIGCGGLLVVGLLLVVAVTIGTNIGMQKAKQQETAEEGETTNTPKIEKGEGEENIPVVIRVSGEQGTRFRCTHFDLSDEGEPIQEREGGQLGSTPVEYRARITDSRERSYTFYASCSIQDADQRGQIKVELLVNGRVVDSGETRPDPPGQTSKAATTVEVTYSPRHGGPDPSKAKK